MYGLMEGEMMILSERKDRSTIAAISTAQAPGGIGIVRISGPGAREVADRVFRSPKGKKVADAAGYTALYGWVFDGEEKLDEAVALVFAAPASFTGEDVVELSATAAYSSCAGYWKRCWRPAQLRPGRESLPAGRLSTENWD